LLPSEVQTATSNEVTGTGDSSQAILDNYWLNEIKSQEDTARQIIAICTLLLGASITLITGNRDRIIDMVKDNINFTSSFYLEHHTFQDQTIYTMSILRIPIYPLCWSNFE
jgi:calcineurin-like phosphoesterase family protein